MNVLAVDIGTSSIKAGLYDQNANSIPGIDITVAHEQDISGDGTAEEPVERIVDAVEQAIDGVLSLVSNKNLKIAAVAMDSMASTILAVDIEGGPLTPVFTYADTRSAEDVELLRIELDESAVHRRTGAMQHTSYVPGRVRWLERTQPSIAEKVARWVDVSTYLHTRWFGTQDVACSYSIASWSGLLNRKTLEWDRDLLSHLGLSAENLPRLAPFTEMRSGLCAEFSKRWPELADVPFLPAIGDGAAVNIGTGCASPVRIALSVGTTSAMRILTDEDPIEVPNGLWAYRLGADSTLVGGAFSEGGLLVEWAKDVLQLPPLSQLDSQLQKQNVAGHGLSVLPFLAGERATGWSTRATGVFEGIRTSTSSIEIIQALMEAVSLRFAMVAELLLPERPDGLVFVASGGAVRSSEWWLQTMANALNAPIAVNEEEQGTSRGAAILALYALGEIDSLHSLQPKVSATYSPQQEAVVALSQAASRQRDLYSRLLG